MAKSETTTEPRAIPLEITGVNALVDDLTGIIDERTYAVSGEDINRLAMQMAERIKYQLDAAERARKAEVVAMDLSSKFEDLKERLHNAEVDNAVMRGYLDRVAEDDHAADGFFEVADRNGEVSARPKRKGFGYRSHGGGVQGSVGYAMTGDGSEVSRPTKRRVHWTSY